MSTPSRDDVRRAPKVLLHDHLDGGLRPQTIIDLAADCGHELPATDAAGLAQWFADSADSGSLVRYLETFDHTVAVMQTGPAITASRASAWRTWSPTAWSTPRSATPPSSTSSRD